MKWNTGFPEKSGKYIVLSHSGDISTIPYSAKYKMFNIDDTDNQSFAELYNENKYISKWVSYDEFLKEQGFDEFLKEQYTGFPEKSDKYVVLYNDGNIESLSYSAHYKMFNVIDIDRQHVAEINNLNKYISKWISYDAFLKDQGLN